MQPKNISCKLSTSQEHFIHNADREQQLFQSFQPDMQDLTATEGYSLSALSVTCLAILYSAFQSNGEPLYASLAIGGLAFAFAYALVQWTGDVFIKRGYKGRDMSKKNATEM